MRARSSAIYPGLALLLACALISSPASAQPPDDSLLARRAAFSPTDSLDAASERELSAALLDGDPAPSQSLWEALQLRDARSQLRARISGLEPGSARPAHLLLGRLQTGNWSYGVLATRDRGEPDAAELLRTSLAWSDEGVELIGGDFRVDQGLGWTVASLPAWSSSTEPDAALRRAGRGLAMQLSSEEGRGWFGLAMAYRPDEAGPDRAGLLDALGEIAPSLEAWVGSASYDARADSGGLIPYANQGDHAGDRAERLELVEETVAGARLEFSRAQSPLLLAMQRHESRWSDPLAPTGHAARFRAAEQGPRWRDRWGASGLETAYLGQSFELRGELTRQDHDAYGGGFAFAATVPGLGKIVGSGWSADSSFAPLHARPYLPFGDDPAGRRGGQLDLVTTPSARSTLHTGGALEQRQASAATAGSSQLREQVHASFGYRIDPRHRAELRLRSRIESSQAAPRERSTVLRGRLDRTGVRGRITLRGEWAAAESGRGQMLALEGRRSSGKLRLAGSLAWLDRTGSGVSFTVVEPGAPGLLPVRRVAGNRWRLAGRLALEARGGVLLWVAGRIDHPLAPASETDRQQLSAGIEWRGQPGGPARRRDGAP